MRKLIAAALAVAVLATVLPAGAVTRKGKPSYGESLVVAEENIQVTPTGWFDPKRLGPNGRTAREGYRFRAVVFDVNILPEHPDFVDRPITSFGVTGFVTESGSSGKKLGGGKIYTFRNHYWHDRKCSKMKAHAQYACMVIFEVPKATKEVLYTFKIRDDRSSARKPLVGSRQFRLPFFSHYRYTSWNSAIRDLGKNDDSPFSTVECEKFYARYVRELKNHQYPLGATSYDVKYNYNYSVEGIKDRICSGLLADPVGVIASAAKGGWAQFCAATLSLEALIAIYNDKASTAHMYYSIEETCSDVTADSKFPEPTTWW